MSEYPKMLTKDGKALINAKTGELVVVNNKQEEEAAKDLEMRPVRNYDLDSSHRK